jgi:hypothetical protein
MYADDPAKRTAFTQALALICAAAVAECCAAHPLHDLAVQKAMESRERTSAPRLKVARLTHKAGLPITGNRAARRAAIRNKQEVAA